MNLPLTEDLVFRIDKLSMLLVFCGLGILWKAITNDLWITRFTGTPVIPRWMYFLGAIAVLALAVWYSLVTGALTSR